MNKTILSLAVIGTLSLAAAADAPKKNAAPKMPAAPKVMVECGYVFEAENVKSRNYTGHIVSPEVVNLVTRVSGDLVKVGFTSGQEVKKGQLLYQLDSIRFEAAVKSAEARIAEIKAKLAYAENNYNRNSSLYTKQVSSKDTVENAWSTVQSLKAELLMAEASLITAKDDLKNTSIYAPISGKIGATNYSAGNYLTPNSGTLATIVQASPLRVVFSISARDYLNTFGNEANLKKDGKVNIVLADNSRYPHEGRFEYIDNQANRRTDTVQINMLIDNPDRVLLAGNTVTIELSRKTGKMLPAVKLSSVMYDSTGPYVYVVDKDKKAVKRPVVLGNMLADKQFVVSGLKKGELIVTDGMHKIMPGQEVIVKMEKGAGK
ncbi:MAG: efflux RND transporter periplasmic adaptor subunit [Lentisphaeria bacterium]|nr:efflux RND transporter periplasmic adaptor subunit [Lentisphaeria bacterium]